MDKLEALCEAGAVTREEIDSLTDELSASALLAEALDRPVNAPDGYRHVEPPVQEFMADDPSVPLHDTARE